MTNPPAWIVALSTQNPPPPHAAPFATSPCRSYNYYLPASILGLQLDGSEADAARLELLLTAWERFQGTHVGAGVGSGHMHLAFLRVLCIMKRRAKGLWLSGDDQLSVRAATADCLPAWPPTLCSRSTTTPSGTCTASSSPHLNACIACVRSLPPLQPFHNYTKRRLYREPAAASDGRRKGRRDRRGQEAEESESGSEADESEAEGEEAAAAAAGGSNQAAAAAAAMADASSSAEAGTSATASSSSGSEAVVGEQQEEGGEARRRHQVQLQWKHERDSADPVTRRHHR